MIANSSFEVVDMEEEEKRDAKEAASGIPQKPKKKYEDGVLSKIKSSEIIKSYSSAKKNFTNQYDKTVLSTSAYKEKQLHQQQSEQVKLNEYRKALEKQFIQEDYEDYELTRKFLLKKVAINLHACCLVIVCLTKLYTMLCEMLGQCLMSTPLANGAISVSKLSSSAEQMNDEPLSEPSIQRIYVSI